jgi:hypothetical protein
LSVNGGIFSEEIGYFSSIVCRGLHLEKVTERAREIYTVLRKKLSFGGKGGCARFH